MTLRAPQSQTADARPISFLLDDQAAGTPPVALTLVIRPEDLVRTDPSRMAVHQTLGGAWSDNFGPGITSIQISGTTGWRRAAGDGEERDGGERFQHLFEHVFTRWHLLRQDAANAGRNPALVQLVFADALDGFAMVVAPTHFVLRRSKSRPLLCQYQIALSVLSLSVDSDPAAHQSTRFTGPIQERIAAKSGLESLLATIGRIKEQAEQVQDFVDRELVGPARAFMQKTAAVYQSVHDAVKAVDNIAGSLIQFGQLTAQAGMNAFRSLAAVAGLPGHVRGRLMEVAASYSNAFCVMRNALQQQAVYPDYSPLFGASNCSSTSGGRPPSALAGENPFFSYTRSNVALPASATAPAVSIMRTLAKSDVVLAPMSKASVRDALSVASGGLFA